MERVEEQQAAAPMIARLHGNPNFRPQPSDMGNLMMSFVLCLKLRLRH
jgi:hypothetical protein